MSTKNGDFVGELQAKQQELMQSIASKKADIAKVDAEQKKLGTLLESEKHGQPNKGKHHAPTKDIRTDIQKNESKFKEQSKKLDDMRREVAHLEDELKAVNHDLRVVQQ
ncbi:MAG: hypothetical protein V4534_04100 [Myxococcota bacterium]